MTRWMLRDWTDGLGKVWDGASSRSCVGGWWVWVLVWRGLWEVWDGVDVGVGDESLWSFSDKLNVEAGCASEPSFRFRKDILLPNSDEQEG